MTKSNLYTILGHRNHKHIAAKGENEINVIHIISKHIIKRCKNSYCPLIVDILLLKL